MYDLVDLLVSYRPLGHADFSSAEALKAASLGKLGQAAHGFRQQITTRFIHAELIPGDGILGLLRFRIHQKAQLRRGLAHGPVRLARRARLVPLAARGEALELHAVARSAAAIRAGRLV